MHIPKQFAQTDIESMHEVILANPLGSLVSTGSAGLSVDHIPFELVTHQGSSGALLGHVARVNPLWREELSSSEALVVFHGAGAYVSPSWYPTKQRTEKVVPTWNYVVVHAYGSIRMVEEKHWIRGHIERLVNREESKFDRPWSVTDAPEEFIEKMLGAIVGIEIEITRLDGKWKLSQNRSALDRAGVAEGLRNLGTPSSKQMAEYVENWKS